MGFLVVDDTAEERISELEDTSVLSLKTEKQRGQRLKKYGISKADRTAMKGVTYM